MSLKEVPLVTVASACGAAVAIHVEPPTPLLPALVEAVQLSVRLFAVTFVAARPVGTVGAWGGGGVAALTVTLSNTAVLKMPLLWLETARPT